MIEIYRQLGRSLGVTVVKLTSICCRSSFVMLNFPWRLETNEPVRATCAHDRAGCSLDTSAESRITLGFERMTLANELADSMCFLLSRRSAFQDVE
jgi:hypothetical protein